MIGGSNDETNFPHKLLLINAQVSKIRKLSANGPSANIKFSKTRFSKMIQSEKFIFSLPNVYDSGVYYLANALFKGFI